MESASNLYTYVSEICIETLVAFSPLMFNASSDFVKEKVTHAVDKINANKMKTANKHKNNEQYTSKVLKEAIIDCFQLLNCQYAPQD